MPRSVVPSQAEGEIHSLAGKVIAGKRMGIQTGRKGTAQVFSVK